MTPRTEALREAQSVHERRMMLSKDDKTKAVRSLAEHRVFSNNHIAELVDMKPWLVSGLTEKSDLTGGEFSPRAIPALLDLIASRTRGEKDVFKTLRALNAGCGIRMMSRLVGMPETTIKRHVEKARGIIDERENAKEASA